MSAQPVLCGPLTSYISAVDGCPDLEAFIHRFACDGGLIWLDSARNHPLTGRWSMLGCDPWLTLKTQGDEITLTTSSASESWRAQPLEALRQVLRRYQIPHREDPLGRSLGLMGFLSYELGRWIECLPNPKPSGLALPEMLWLGMRLVILVDHFEKRSWLCSVVDPHQPEPLAAHLALERLRDAQACLREQAPLLQSSPWWSPTGRARGTSNNAPMGATSRPPAGISTTMPPTAGGRGAMAGSQVMPPEAKTATITQMEFEEMVLNALEYIRAGEIFQANLAQRFIVPWQGEPSVLYQRLRQINPSPFACYMKWQDMAVVSCSPERLVRVQGSRIHTRPIAGTRPRGKTAQQDLVNSLDLLINEKERAEHLMLVDLARNDLGRVCAYGTVDVAEFMTLEDYSHVIHIVSDVSGILRKEMDAVDVLRAVFPAGTITGCPKVRSMQIIHELEPIERGLYTGSLGFLGFDGTLDLNIAIRTMVIQGNSLSFYTGAGIVADSDPEKEYAETLAKAGALIEALQAKSQSSDAFHRRAAS
ncbi:MAG: anthranilate synthase component I family protein [Candidatus Omnitrophica bacterium]|nr:anthranilate synthase component I family protein [Candidatus Omnitrophota bacterium]